MLKITHIPEVESTNQSLKMLLQTEAIEEGSIVITDYQTAGKGQSTNFWESEKGKNLTFSIVLFPNTIKASKQFAISQLISLAIVDSLKTKIDKLSIKWPNDIYVGDKKIAGILIENVIAGNYLESCIVGIGININQAHFKSNAPNPVSLKQLTGTETNLTLMLKKILGNIFARYSNIDEDKQEKLHKEYFSCLYRNSGFYPYQSKKCTFKARIVAVLPSGEIVLEKYDGSRETFQYKEIEAIIK